MNQALNGLLLSLLTLVEAVEIELASLLIVCSPHGGSRLPDVCTTASISYVRNADSTEPVSKASPFEDRNTVEQSRSKQAL